MPFVGFAFSRKVAINLLGKCGLCPVLNTQVAVVCTIGRCKCHRSQWDLSNCVKVCSKSLLSFFLPRFRSKFMEGKTDCSVSVLSIIHTIPFDLQWKGPYAITNLLIFKMPQDWNKKNSDWNMHLNVYFFNYFQPKHWCE